MGYAKKRVNGNEKSILMVKDERESTPMIKGILRLFGSVVAQFIGRLCLINQATTKIWS
jgi:hypothetical protein